MSTEVAPSRQLHILTIWLKSKALDQIPNICLNDYQSRFFIVSIGNISGHIYFFKKISWNDIEGSENY